MDIIAKHTYLPALLKDGEYIDPEFLTLDNMSMQDSLHCPSSVIANKLAHQITRSHNDLRSHVQRIFIFIEQAKPDAAFSGLVDLFLVLEDKGSALKKRMLLSAKQLLSEEQFDFLRQSLSLGLVSNTHLKKARYSILTDGRKSNESFIHKVVLPEDRPTDVIEQARSYLEYGQIDQARIMLEQAILDEPEKVEYQQELLDIFQKLADRVLFISFYEQLLERKKVLPLLWQQLAEDFNYKSKA
jgi:tetratricopeptide (TPR) repeat protein